MILLLVPSSEVRVAAPKFSKDGRVALLRIDSGYQGESGRRAIRWRTDPSDPGHGTRMDVACGSATFPSRTRDGTPGQRASELTGY